MFGVKKLGITSETKIFEVLSLGGPNSKVVPSSTPERKPIALKKHPQLRDTLPLKTAKSAYSPYFLTVLCSITAKSGCFVMGYFGKTEFSIFKLEIGFILL